MSEISSAVPMDGLAGRSERAGRLAVRAVLKNALAIAVVAAIVAAAQTGYLSPDRPTRAQWDGISRAKSLAAGQTVFESDFGKARIGSGPGSPWDYYNGATANSVTSDESGVTVTYIGIGWIGARLDVERLEPGAIYRISVEAETTGQPGAIIVRNRQRDLVRERIPVGRGTTRAHFAAPPGRFDKVIAAFIPDAASDPQGSMKILSVKIERMGS
jgi:hypothetical protein